MRERFLPLATALALGGLAACSPQTWPHRELPPGCNTPGMEEKVTAIEDIAEGAVAEALRSGESPNGVVIIGQVRTFTDAELACAVTDENRAAAHPFLGNGRGHQYAADAIAFVLQERPEITSEAPDQGPYEEFDNE